MSRSALLACMRKELQLLTRDWHGMLLLFVMPLAFVVIMSLALQNEFATREGRRILVLTTDADGTDPSHELLAALAAGEAFELRAIDTPPDALATVARHEQAAFVLDIAAGYAAALAAGQPAATRVTVHVAADTARQTELIFIGVLREALARQRIATLLGPLGAPPVDDNENRPVVSYLYRNTGKASAPSSVQQSVPAWLVFGAFFIVIPLSNTLIRERQQGTLRRLRTTPIDQATVFAGKIVPYFLVNQLQVLLMLAAGCYLVPLLGGEALRLNGSMLALAVVAAALSVAAIGYALLVATVTRTTEQATLLGGAGNLILAALGGVMVPRFVMPEAMQQLTNISPMSWGLEGFLDVLLRGGAVSDVLPRVAGLLLFGGVTLGVALLLQSRRADA